MKISNDYFEIISPNIIRGQIRQALFDFDGTLSLIREGWQNIMIPMMVEILQETPHHESVKALTELVAEFVHRLTGKQTIYQMIRLTEEVQKRGGDPLTPLAYKWMYLERMNDHIMNRINGLASGEINPEALIVPGSYEILNHLKTYGVTCYLASGTDEVYVTKEAAALKIDHYFAGIYGARDDYQNFSKKMVIENIINENQLNGPEFVAFGDGYVEIEDTHMAGGIAVGVASNEATRQGIDEWKRRRLIEAGADIIIPDFRHQEPLINYLFEGN
jgi:phosphoglycolate phosphatase-like HAD superfamily hydrolase